MPASDIKDPQKLGLKLWVNDVLKQDSNTSDMIFNLAEQIAQLSSGMTLHPGDLILTGTPAGVGAARGEFLKAGDMVKLWIEKIGDADQQDGLMTAVFRLAHDRLGCVPCRRRACDRTRQPAACAC